MEERGKLLVLYGLTYALGFHSVVDAAIIINCNTSISTKLHDSSQQCDGHHSLGSRVASCLALGT